MSYYYGNEKKGSLKLGIYVLCQLMFQVVQNLTYGWDGVIYSKL